MNETLFVSKRFAGPPGMGNGGYVCGLMAGFFDDAAQITLRRPVMLDTPLHLERPFPNTIHLCHDRQLIAEATPDNLELELPHPPHIADILAAQKQIDYGRSHPFPHCFVCGPERVPGDGLCIFPVPLPGQNMVAALWEPDKSLANGNDRIRPEYLWAALDCPGGIAAVADRPRPIVLGRLSGRVFPGICAGERCVVVGWRLGGNGRKHVVGTALFTESGERLGYARATWIELSKPQKVF